MPEINADRMRTPNASVLIPGVAASIGRRVLEELARHTPTLARVSHTGRYRWWACSCESGGQHLPSVRLATAWESHVLEHVALAVIGLPEAARGGLFGAAVHDAHYKRVNEAAAKEPTDG